MTMSLLDKGIYPVNLGLWSTYLRGGNQDFLKEIEPTMLNEQ